MRGEGGGEWLKESASVKSFTAKVTATCKGSGVKSLLSVKSAASKAPPTIHCEYGKVPGSIAARNPLKKYIGAKVRDLNFVSNVLGRKFWYCPTLVYFILACVKVSKSLVSKKSTGSACLF